MTQRDLADKLHVTPQAVSLMENGRSPKIVHLGELARALSVTTTVTTTDLINGLGYTGEPIIVTGAGKAGTEGRGTRG